MKRIGQLTVFALCLVFSAAGLATKPTSPLTVSLDAVGEPKAGQTLQLVANIASRATVGRVDVELKLPPGVKLLEGRETLSVSLVAGQKMNVSYRVLLPSVLSGVIAISADTGKGRGIRYAARDRVSLGAASLSPRSTAGKKGFEKKEVNGRSLREYTLQ